MDNLSSLTSDGMAPHVLATHIRVCAPATALKQVRTDDLRRWYICMPGALRHFGCFRFPGEWSHIYEGGLTTGKNLFLFVPHDLYQQHRRALLLQLGRESGITSKSELRAYCKRAERQLSPTASLYLCDRQILDVDHRVQQVDYWARFLAYRQEPPLLNWCW
jgi:hypothetical protein